MAEADVAVGDLLVSLRVKLDVLLVAADGVGVASNSEKLVTLFLQRHNYHPTLTLCINLNNHKHPQCKYQASFSLSPSIESQ